MRKSKVLPLIYLLFFSLGILNAQNVDQKVSIEWMEEVKDKDTPPSNLYSLGNSNSLLFNVRYHSSKYNSKVLHINLVTKDLNILKSKSINSKDFCKNCNIWLSQIGHQFYVKITPEKDIDPILLYKFDIESFDISSESHQIDNQIIDEEESVSAFTFTSKDHNYYFSGQLNKNKASSRMWFKLYDENFNVVVDQSTIINSPSVVFQSSRVDSHGNIYIIVSTVKETEEKDKEGRPLSKWITSIHTCSPKNTDIQVVEIPFEKGKWINELAIISKEESGIFCSGSYFEKEVERNWKKKKYLQNTDFYVEKAGRPTVGKFSFSFHPTDGFTTTKYFPYPKHVLAFSHKEENRKKAKRKEARKKDKPLLKGVPHLEDHRMIRLDNGDIAEFSEVYVEHGFYMSGKLNPEYVHMLGKILIALYSPDGELKWIKSIDRVNYERKNHWRLHHSTFFSQKNRIGVVYVDGSSNYLNLYDSKDGSKKQKSLDGIKKKEKILLIPLNTKRMDENTFFLCRRKGKKIKFGRIIFE